MKILMKTLAAGPAGVLLPGKTYDVAEDQARQLVAGNYATSAEPPAPVLHATAPPPPAQQATAPAAPAALGRRKRT